MKRTNGHEPNPRKRIKQLEEELAKVRMLGRTRREPIDGFGGRIQTLRELSGIGLSELAVKAGVSKGLISRIETDPQANPTLWTIYSLAKALDITASELLSK